jgi:hypothetical protein
MVLVSDCHFRFPLASRKISEDPSVIFLDAREHETVVEYHRFLAYFQVLQKAKKKGGIYDSEQLYPKSSQTERPFSHSF